MAEVRRSLALSAASSYLSVALQLASTLVLSRVLTPTEVGVFAVAAVFAALASNFRDFGIAEYMIQAKDLTHERIRAAFGVNVILSWSMGALILLAAAPVSAFYRAEDIGRVMQVQAMSFALIPFGAINMAWFRREMNFKPQLVASMASGVVSLCVAISLALSGFGAMSMAWSTFAGIVVTVAVSMAYRPAGFPRLPGVRGMREVLKFGSAASGIYVLGQLGRNAPELIIGRVQGVADVAMFSRASGLVQLFNQLVIRAVMPVCLPYFARSLREEQTVVPAYMRSVAIFTVVGWTFLGCLALAAFPAVRTVYGDQWGAAVPLARIVCIAGAIDLIHHMSKEALLSHGLAGLASRLQLLLQSVRVLGLLAVIPFGLTGAAWGLLVAAVVNVGISQWHLHSGAGLRLHHLWQACRTSLGVSALSLLPMAALCLAVPATEDNYLRFLVGGCLMTAVAWLGALRLLSHPLWAEIEKLAGPGWRRLSRRRGG